MDPNTNNIGLLTPLRGSNVGTWDVPTNGNSSALDGFIGGIQVISVSNTPITLTAPAGSITPSGGPTQSQNKALKFTGALTANVQVTLPLPGDMIIHNLTTGNFVIVLRPIAGGLAVCPPPGVASRVYNDGTNAYLVDLPGVGTYLDYAGSSVPNWIADCDVPPFLNCNGSTFSGTTYPVLASILGGTTLPDLRGVSRATLNQGTGRITSAVSGIDGNTIFSIGGAQSQTLTAAQIPSISSINGSQSISVNTGGFNVPGSTGAISDSSTNGGGQIVAMRTGGSAFSGLTGFSGNNSIAVTSNNTGGQPHPIMGPTTISGITLIRAA
jgi:microcystin-dependent protein